MEQWEGPGGCCGPPAGRPRKDAENGGNIAEILEPGRKEREVKFFQPLLLHLGPMGNIVVLLLLFHRGRPQP